jgi:hypothetical protein
MTGKGRTVAEPSFASSTVQAFTSKENRSIVTAAGLFAVRHSQIQPKRIPESQDEDARTEKGSPVTNGVEFFRLASHFCTAVGLRFSFPRKHAPSSERGTKELLERSVRDGSESCCCSFTKCGICIKKKDLFCERLCEQYWNGVRVV